MSEEKLPLLVIGSKGNPRTNSVLTGLGGQKLLLTGFDLNLFGPKVMVSGSAFKNDVAPLRNLISFVFKNPMSNLE